MPKFGIKNVWFGYFWTGIWKEYCYIWNQHPRIYLIAKFLEETKMPKFGTKYALFGYFQARILEFVKNEFLTHTVDFGPLYDKVQVRLKYAFLNKAYIWLLKC